MCGNCLKLLLPPGHLSSLVSSNCLHAYVTRIFFYRPVKPTFRNFPEPSGTLCQRGLKLPECSETWELLRNFPDHFRDLGPYGTFRILDLALEPGIMTRIWGPQNPEPAFFEYVVSPMPNAIMPVCLPVVVRTNFCRTLVHRSGPRPQSSHFACCFDGDKA